MKTVKKTIVRGVGAEKYKLCLKLLLREIKALNPEEIFNGSEFLAKCKLNTAFMKAAKEGKFIEINRVNFLNGWKYTGKIEPEFVTIKHGSYIDGFIKNYNKIQANKTKNARMVMRGGIINKFLRTDEDKELISNFDKLLDTVSIDLIFQELKKRGFSGELKRTETVSFKI